MVLGTITKVKDNKFLFTNTVELSKNIKETKEGYLECYNVIMGRSGYQEYSGYELGGMGFSDNEIVKVWRDETDVFREETLSSALGKPVTDEHPSVDVDSTNINELGKGTILTKLWRVGDDMVGNIIITNKELVNIVKDRKKRELSLGYSTLLINEGGRVRQTDIRINHLAVVKRGRAENAKILDEKKIESKGENNMSLNEELLNAINTLNKNGIKFQLNADEKAKEKEEETKDEGKKEKDSTVKPEKETKDKVKEEDKKEEKAEDEKGETKEKEETQDEETKETKDADKVEDKEKKENKEMVTKDNKKYLNALADGVINRTEYEILTNEKSVEVNANDGIFGDVKPVDNKVEKVQNVNDFVGIKGNEYNEFLQKRHNDNFSRRVLDRKYKSNEDVRRAIEVGGSVDTLDVYEKMGGNK